MQAREIRQVIKSRPTTDGAGVNIKRLTGYTDRLSMDPFLMLDEIRSEDKDEFIAGFPPHPHRGFETITYMRAGGFSHQDSMGNRGSIAAGGAQWMKAGSGVIHSEMPAADADRMHGFQFWLNLPAAEKMQPPEYRDIQADEVVRVQAGAAGIGLIAGTIGVSGEQIDGAVTGKTTAALIADVELPAGGTGSIEFDTALASQFYVYQGSVRVGHETVSQGELAYLSAGDLLQIDAEADSGLLLFGGVPINEPVVHYGPFVMNTDAEIAMAIRDYKEGTLVQGDAVLLS